jgi:hypothetical protein
MKPKPTFRTLTATALVLVGLCFGNLLHQVISHSSVANHGKESPLTCLLCAATQHASGNLDSETPDLAAPLPVSTEVPPALPAPCLPADHRLSPPRSPPQSA